MIRIFRTRWLGLAAIAMSGPALATLGGTADSVQADAAAMLMHREGAAQTRALPRMRNVTPERAIGLYKVYAYRTSFGSEIREYLFGDVVFGVAWSGPVVPDLARLLGDSYAAYTKRGEDMRQDARFTIRSPLQVETDKLVIVSEGRSPAFRGHAFFPHKLPAGVSGQDIR